MHSENRSSRSHSLPSLSLRPADWLPVGLQDYLAGIQGYLVNKTRLVLVLVINQYVGTSLLAEALTVSTLDTKAYSPASGNMTWPTLDTLLSNGTQLVVLSDNAANWVYGPASNKPSWLLPTYEYAWTTSTTEEQAGNLDCAPAKGSNDTHKLRILVHAITQPAPLMNIARSLNTRANLTAQIDKCASTPNLLSVAFSDFGDVVALANDLNH